MDIEDYSNDSFNADTENSKVKKSFVFFFSSENELIIS